MSRLPAENRNVVGLEGPEYPKYRVGPLCSAPGCSRLADHGHHLWPRSFVIGDKCWVKLWDGQIIGNRVALCHLCHSKITENKAHIKWTGTAFTWNDSLMAGMLLDPQPPIWGATIKQDKSDKEPVGPAAVEKCPECLRALPREKTKEEKEATKHRKSWTVAVPVDAREDGAETLNVLLAACADLFGHSDEKKLKFYTLSQALALVVTHGHMLVGDGDDQI